MSTQKKESSVKISRAEASNLLSVSVRTIDRYIRAGKLSSQKIESAIWLNKKDVLSLAALDKVTLSTPSVSADVHVDTGRQEYVNRSELVDSLSTPSSENALSNNKIFEELYYKLQEDNKEKQQRLEIANYRVGQLESQIQSSIPLIEHQKHTEKRQEELKKLYTQLLKQTIIKWILILLLLVLLALQPLWFISSGQFPSS